MSWVIVLPVGIIVGILFSSAYPEMASGINGAIAPPLEAVGESQVDKIKDATVSVLGN